MAFADIGGWDTHVNEVGATAGAGQLANLLGNFGQALAAFYQDLGDRMADVSRRHHERVRAHRPGEWQPRYRSRPRQRDVRVRRRDPGRQSLRRVARHAPEQLYEKRDLELTTDFRDVLGELVTRHLGNRQITNVFPGYARPRFRGIVTA